MNEMEIALSSILVMKKLKSPMTVMEGVLAEMGDDKLAEIIRHFEEAAAWGAFWTAGFLEGHHSLSDDPSDEMRVITKKGRSFYLTELLMARLQEDFPAALVGKPASPP